MTDPTSDQEPHSGTGQPPQIVASVDLDDTVHQRVRLGMLSVLHEVDRADFAYLRTALQLTDGNLSRHLDVLARDALVDVEKGYHGRRPRTWVKITAKGRKSLANEMDALRRLVTRYDLLTHD